MLNFVLFIKKYVNLKLFLKNLTTLTFHEVPTLVFHTHRNASIDVLNNMLFVICRSASVELALKIKSAISVFIIIQLDIVA